MAERELTPKVRLLSKNEPRRFEAWAAPRVWSEGYAEGWVSTYFGWSALGGSWCNPAPQRLDPEANIRAQDPQDDELELG